MGPGVRRASSAKTKEKRKERLAFDFDRALGQRRIYDPLRTALYTPAELMTGYRPDKPFSSLDDRILVHAARNGRNGGRMPALGEALLQRIHDAHIDLALRAYLRAGPSGLSRAHRVVGIMGGHLELRGSPSYRAAAEVGRRLARAGYHVVTGGGPGIMEAGNLGAYLAGEGEEDFAWALDQLARAPHYSRTDVALNARYHAAAVDVLVRFPKGRDNLAIPTWFYGREPANLFATAIAKYFSNSLREDGLIAIGTYGIVFAKGSAATRQEIFLSAAMNHYAEFQWCSPMVFLGAEDYRDQTGVFEVVERTANDNYRDMVLLTDAPKAIVPFLRAHPPRRPQVKTK